MVAVLAAVCLTILMVLLLLQLAWGWRFVRQFPPRNLPAVPDGEWPHVLVILPVRGADPSLEGCLRGLLQQNYPHYHIRIIIDSCEDPAWNLVHEIVGRDCSSRVQVSHLQTPLATCGLKSSALLQALGTLDETCQAVALIDADVIPHPTWLRDLVMPLTKPDVGATTGIRWFRPESTAWGALVRYLWNVAASVQMYALHIPWGGSLALRADVFRRSNLLQKWGVSLWEDTASYRTIRDLGLQLEFVPAATMINRESTDLKSCFRFIRRQMLNVRLYHGSWPAIVAQGLATAAACGGALGLVLVGLATGNGTVAAFMSAGLALQVAILAVAMRWIEAHIHRTTRGLGEEMPSFSLRLICAIPLAQVVY